MSAIRNLQKKIIEIMLFIDAMCRENGIIYYIMGGTALGAVRHKGFIPWDDDLDIFMTPQNYEKFRMAFHKKSDARFFLQEWMGTKQYLEHAKVRLNGTAYIESTCRENKEMHQGIYVDIMILHKCRNNFAAELLTYICSKYATFYGLSKRGWIPKNQLHKISLAMLKITPGQILANLCYSWIYKWDNSKNHYVYCYFISKTSFRQGIIPGEVFQKPTEIEFEGVQLLAPSLIQEYLAIRYGDYMKLPDQKDREAAIHAEIYDTEKDYSFYL